MNIVAIIWRDHQPYFENPPQLYTVGWLVKETETELHLSQSLRWVDPALGATAYRSAGFVIIPRASIERRVVLPPDGLQ